MIVDKYIKSREEQIIQIENLCINCMQEKNTQSEICPHCGFDAATYMVNASHLSPFTILNGRYVLGKALGQGGFGIVYIGRDLYLNVIVAIKELFPSNLMSRTPNGFTQKLNVSYVDSPDFANEIKRKFIEEARTIAQLENTDGVVSVKDLFEENGTAYMVMEYLEGQSLKEYLDENGEMDFSQLVTLLKPVIDSVAVIHNSGIVHRDISPDNIMLLTNGKAKLLDFGGAKDVRNSQNRSEMVQVKRGYTPIEQYQVNGNVGPWTDIYALCATIYRGITGKVPPEPMEVSKEGIIPPSKLGIKIPPSAEKILMKGLEIDREKRPQSIEELKNGLYQDKQGEKKGTWKKALLIGVVAVGILGAGGYGMMQLLGRSDNTVSTSSSQNDSGGDAVVLKETERAKNIATETAVVEETLSEEGTEKETIESEAAQVVTTEETMTEVLFAKAQQTEAAQAEKVTETEAAATEKATETEAAATEKATEAKPTETAAAKAEAESEAESETESETENSSTVPMDVIQIGDPCYIEPRAYIIASASQPDIILGVYNSYLDNNMYVTTLQYDSYDSNVFHLKENANDYYTLTAMHSNMNLAHNQNGQVCQQAEGDEQWRFLYAGIGESGENLFFIQNSENECMSISGEGTEQSVYVKDYSQDDVYEKWRLIPVNESDIKMSEAVSAVGNFWEIADGIYEFRSLEDPTILCTIAGGYWDDGTSMIPGTESDANNQRFYVKKREENDEYDIMAVHSSKYILSDANGQLVKQYGQESIPPSGWSFLYAGDGCFYICNSENNCVCYNENEGNITLSAFKADDISQIWQVWPAEAKEGDYAAPVNTGDYVELPDGLYEISSSANGSSCWAISQEPSESDTKSIIIWERVLDSTQSFYLERLPDEDDVDVSLYAIRSAQQMDKVLGINESGMVQTAVWNNEPTQKWMIVYGGYGTFLIQSLNGQMLTCQNGDFTNGMPLTAADYQDDMAASFKWYIKGLEG